MAQEILQKRKAPKPKSSAPAPKSTRVALTVPFAVPELPDASKPLSAAAISDPVKISEAAIDTAHQSLASIEQMELTPALGKAASEIHAADNFEDVAPLEATPLAENSPEVLNTIAATSASANPLTGLPPEVLDAMKDRRDLVMPGVPAPEEALDENVGSANPPQFEDLKKKYAAQIAVHENAIALLRAAMARSPATYDATPKELLVHAQDGTPASEPASPEPSEGS